MTASLAVNSFTLSNMRVHLTLSGVPTYVRFSRRCRRPAGAV